jgi:hypothetical protein
MVALGSYNHITRTAFLITLELQSPHKNGFSCHLLLTVLSQNRAHLHDANAIGRVCMLPSLRNRAGGNRCWSGKEVSQPVLPISVKDGMRWSLPPGLSAKAFGFRPQMATL